MKRSIMLLVCALAVWLPAQADDRPYRPRLGDIMGATQLRHFKLWHAGKEKNWALADY